MSAIASSRAATPARAARRGLDRFDTALLAVFGLLSLWVVGSDLVMTLIQGRLWTHTDGFFDVDQLQYLAWIQSSVQHGLISNLFVLRATPADYFQPAIMLSALLVRLGMSSWLALMLWKPVAVITMFLATRALMAHCFARSFDRRAALVLGLLYCSISVSAGKAEVFGDMASVWQSWGYPFGLIGVAFIIWGMLGYARARASGRIVWLPGVLGAIAGLIHPWQGEMMFLILLFAEAVRLGETRARLRAADGKALRVVAGDPGVRLAVVTLVLVAIPLLYFFALGHLDPVWRMSQAQALHSFSTTAVLIAAGPLLVFALLGYRGRPADFVELMMRAWLPATIVMWLFAITSLGATPQHSVNGLSLPMAVLAVLGVRRAGLDRLPRARWWATAAVVLGVVPGTVFLMSWSHTFTNPAHHNANFITSGESDALNYLHADPVPGGVLSTTYLGEAIPGITGRPTFVGDHLWSEPDFARRSKMVVRLFAGRLSRSAARRFVIDSGARFLLIPCEPHVDPAGQLSGLIVSTRRFGCATLSQLRAPGPAKGPLADAATTSVS